MPVDGQPEGLSAIYYTVVTKIPSPVVIRRELYKYTHFWILICVCVCVHIHVFMCF